jgi:hypothetical protein
VIANVNLASLWNRNKQQLLHRLTLEPLIYNTYTFADLFKHIHKKSYTQTHTHFLSSKKYRYSLFLTVTPTYTLAADNHDGDNVYPFLMIKASIFSALPRDPLFGIIIRK